MRLETKQVDLGFRMGCGWEVTCAVRVRDGNGVVFEV